MGRRKLDSEDWSPNKVHIRDRNWRIITAMSACIIGPVEHKGRSKGRDSHVLRMCMRVCVCAGACLHVC